MQVVINISETLKDIADKDDIKTFSHFMWQSILIDAIKNGTPVQKGHKVIDAYALQEHLALVPMEDRTYREAVEIIDRFPSIAEADRSEEENKKEKHTCISCRFYRYDRRTWPCDDCLDYDRWKEAEE